MLFATIGELTGSILWGVYTYRLHNLPLFIPPAHGLVYLTALSRSPPRLPATRAMLVATRRRPRRGLGRARADRPAAPATSPARSACRCCCSSSGARPNRAVYAGVFLVVAALELYGTAIGTWRWAPALPGLGIPDGNPPSGVASGYVWFDVMALLVAPLLLRSSAGRRTSCRSERPLPESSAA